MFVQNTKHGCTAPCTLPKTKHAVLSDGTHNHTNPRAKLQLLGSDAGEKPGVDVQPPR